MQNLKTLLIGLVSFVFLFTACEGPSGPPGLDGLNGRDGFDGGAVIFELENQNFNSGNGFTISSDIPPQIDITDGDILLVYRRSTSITSPSGEVWELLPQSFFIEGETIQYSFNHTKDDVDIRINGNIELTSLSSEDVNDFLIDQKFRVAFIPTLDFNNQNAKILRDFYEYDVIAKDATFLNFTE